MADDTSDGGEGGAPSDPWANLSLDDEFVKGASITEQTARSRQKGAARKARAQRRRFRARRFGGFIRRYSLLGVAAAVVAVLAVLGSMNKGPLASVLGAGRRTDSAAAPATTSPSTSSTSTTFVLLGADQRPGTCLTWNQDLGGGGQRRVDVVPCSEPHLFEATQQFQFDASGYGDDGPTDEQWNAISAYSCQQDADEFLGYHLDPAGRFRASLLTPTTEGWRAGDRHVYCGMVANQFNALPEAGAYRHPSFTGPVEGADQTFLYGTGTCFGTAYGQWFVTDCAGPHITETVGTTEFDAPAESPYPGDTLQDEIRDACKKVAADVYGRPLVWPVTAGSFGIAESSWNIGRRTIECFLGTASEDGTWLPTSGPLRAG